MKSNERAKLVDWPKQIDISSIHATFGSPNWIVSETQLKENITQFKQFTEHLNHILFPIKANPSQSVLTILADAGLGADCANKAEIEMALLAGFEPHNISYNSPIQDLSLCLYLLEQGATIVLDDIDVIHQLALRLAQKEIEGHIFLRINPQRAIEYVQEDENQELMSHAERSSKFGIPAEQLIDVIGQLSMPISGLHLHVGTQMDNLKSFETAILELHDLADQLEAINKPIKYLNLGGGLGIPFNQADCFPSLTHWASTMKNLKDKRFLYAVEPGHALVGNAVALLSEVKSIKSSRGKRWGILDVGTDQLAKVTLLKWPHRILNTHGTEFCKGTDALAGPLCFSGDTLLNNIDLGDIRVNDPVIITEVGAYTYSLSNKFNGRLSPGWLFLNETGEVQRTVNMEKSIDNIHFALNNWNQQTTYKQPIDLSHALLENLSSNYLSDLLKKDSYSFITVQQISAQSYLFEVQTSSEVDFISAPFALRLFGDAAIIALLHHQGLQHKEHAVWARKSTVDSFDILPSNCTFKFRIDLSKTFGTHFKTTIARFQTACGKCSGTFVLKN